MDGHDACAAVAAAGDRVAVVIDRDRARARALADPHGAETADDPEAAAGCDAAIIATPSAAHLEQATNLAAMGLPVLVEKPHRLPGQGAAALRAAIAHTGAPVRVGMTTRHHPGIRRLKEGLADGTLGDVLSWSDAYAFHLTRNLLSAWYFDPAHAGGGVLTTNGVHLIDRAGWLLGEELRAIDAHGLTPIFPGHLVEDHAHIRLAAGEVPVTLSLLWSPVPCPPPELTVTGTRGIARIGLDAWTIETAAGSDSGTPDDAEAGFAAQWRAFREVSAGGGRAPDVPDIETLERTMRLIERLYAMARRESLG